MKKEEKFGAEFLFENVLEIWIFTEISKYKLGSLLSIPVGQYFNRKTHKILGILLNATLVNLCSYKWNKLRYNILTLVISDLNCLVVTRVNQSEQTPIIFVLMAS